MGQYALLTVYPCVSPGVTPSNFTLIEIYVEQSQISVVGNLTVLQSPPVVSLDIPNSQPAGTTFALYSNKNPMIRFFFFLFENHSFSDTKKKTFFFLFCYLVCIHMVHFPLF